MLCVIYCFWQFVLPSLALEVVAGPDMKTVGTEPHVGVHVGVAGSVLLAGAAEIVGLAVVELAVAVAVVRHSGLTGSRSSPPSHLCRFWDILAAAAGHSDRAEQGPAFAALRLTSGRAHCNAAHSVVAARGSAPFTMPSTGGPDAAMSNGSPLLWGELRKPSVR